MTPKFKIGDKVVLSDGYTCVVDCVGICYTMETRYSLYSEDSLSLYVKPEEIIYEAWESSDGAIVFSKTTSKASNLYKQRDWTRVPELDKKIVRK